jgi:peptide/nickel transport system substrate-binding protein
MSEIDYWKQQLANGKVGRREFIGRAVTLGLTTALATTLASKIAGAAPKRGGFLRVGLGAGATTDTLDPATYPDSFMGMVGWGSLGNSLTEVDAKGEVTPDLAESVEPSDQAKTWVFTLRKGLTFHNGKDVTSEDVIASFRHHMGKDSKSAAKSILEPVIDIKADGKDKVVFTLSAGSTDFPYLTSDYHLPIMPAKDGDVDWRSGIRTGPFTLEAFEPGVRAKMKRFANYHKSGQPYIDECEVLSIIDVTARTNALVTGDVHYIDRCDLKTLNLLQRNKNIKILEVTGYGHYVFPMLTNVAPFNDNNVRLALKYALDRDDILKKVFLGHGTVGNDDPIAPSIKYAINPAPIHKYDPDKAKFHLKKAGLSTLKVDLSAADTAFAGALDAAVLYQAHAARAGIDINVIREPNDGYWDNVWMKKPWCASYWNGRPTCDWMFTTAYAADAAWNDTAWKNPRFNELLLQARSAPDGKERAAMYAEMQQLLHDDGGVVVLVFNAYVDAYSDKLDHGAVASNLEDDGLKLPARWWFA